MTITAEAKKRRHPDPPPALIFATLPAAIESNAITSDSAAPYRLHEWDGTIDTLRHHAHDRRGLWGAVQMDATTLSQACREGLVLPRPPVEANAPTTCGYDGGVVDYVLAWDQSRLHDVADGAINWAAFWDIARHPGKRGLRADPRGTLEIALMADGVAAQDVYATLATEDGIARAFRRLDLLRPYIVWWTTGDEARAIMRNGAALMTTTPAGEIMLANPAPAQPGMGFAAQWLNGLRDNVFWAIPANVPDAQRDRIRAILLQNAPHHDDSRQAPLTNAPLLATDDAFWQQHLADLQSRFDTWRNNGPQQTTGGRK